MTCHVSIFAPVERWDTHVEPLSGGECLSVVQRLDRGKDIGITLHEGSDLHEKFTTFETGSVVSPDILECVSSSVEGDVDIGGCTFHDGAENLAGGGVDSAV